MRRPVCVSWCAPARFDAIGDLAAFATRVTRKQSGKPVRCKALAPEINEAVAAVEFGPDLGPRVAIGQQQNQTGTTHCVGPPIPRADLLLKFHAFAFGE